MTFVSEELTFITINKRLEIFLLTTPMQYTFCYVKTCNHIISVLYLFFTIVFSKVKHKPSFIRS